MSIHFEGWIEIQWQLAQEQIWFPCVSLFPIVTHFLEMKKIFLPDQERRMPGLGGRGIPSDISPATKQNIEIFHDHSEETWCYWSELEPLLSSIPIDQDWNNFLHIFSFLSQKYGERRVRLVLWVHYNMS